MNGVNRVTLIGNMTADPEEKQGRDDPFATFSVAINRGSGDDKDTTFLDCVAYEKLGKQVLDWGRKGRLVYVEGSVIVRKWEDKEGNKRQAYGIRCWQVQFLDRPPEDDRPKSKSLDDDLPW